MSITRKRVLVIEDEFLVATLIEDMLGDLGYEVAGSAQRLDTALALARSERFDLCLLDLQLGRIRTHAVVDVLITRRIPFAFVTGHDRDEAERAYRGVPVLQKPFRLQDLAATIDRLLAGGPAEP
jgi:CheY-like chemotaxis protein